MESKSSGKTGGSIMSFAIGVIVGVFAGTFFIIMLNRDKD